MARDGFLKNGLEMSRQSLRDSAQRVDFGEAGQKESY